MKLSMIAPLAALLALAACTNPPGTVIINLTQAQSIAKQVDTDLKAAIAPVLAGMNPVQQALAMQAEADLDMAVAAFTGVPNGPVTYEQLADTVLTEIKAVVDVVPMIPPAAKLAADVAIPALEAFIAGLPMPAVTPAPA